MLRLSGEQAINIAQKMAPTSVNGSILVLWLDIYQSTGVVLDQVVMTTFKPWSFTGEDTVEFSCHGNPLIVDAIINLAIGYGARMARAGEFTTISAQWKNEYAKG